MMQDFVNKQTNNMKKKIEERLAIVQDDIIALEMKDQRSYMTVEWKILAAKRELLTELLNDL